MQDAARLHRSRHRREQGLFLADGPQAAREALSARVHGEPAVVRLLATRDGADGHVEVVEAAVAAGVPVVLVADRALDAVSGSVTPQGVVAVTRDVCVAPEELPAALDLVAVLAGVTDPGNVGAVLRVADAAGADAVVVAAGSADPRGTKAVRASAGSLFHLPVVADLVLAGALEAVAGRGLRLLAADGATGEDLDSVADAGGLDAPLALVVGNEAAGLDPAALAACDAAVAVPLHGRAESLNVATAAAVCLYAVARAHRRARAG